MLLDRFEEEGVTNTTPELGGLRPDEAMVDLRPFELGVLRGPAERTDQGPGATLWDLSGAALRGGGRQARLFECFGHACYGCRSHLREGYLILRSEAEALGARVPVGLEGGFTLRDGGRRFEPRRLEALGAPVPPAVYARPAPGSELRVSRRATVWGGLRR
jgi:hypothetical protein